MTTSSRNTTTKIEDLALVAILIIVAGFAGAASFTHVKDWTLANSLPGTPAWFGWANAVISELVPVAALLTIRRRRRTRAPVGYPLALLIAAASLSLAAQLAVAKPGPSGWLLAAVPALAFMALAKLVFSSAPSSPATAEPALIRTAPTTPDNTAVLARVTDTAPPPVINDEIADDVPARLVSAARMVIVQHRQTSTEPITADELAARLGTSPAIAGQLLTSIDNPAPINGNTPTLDGAR